MIQEREKLLVDKEKRIAGRMSLKARRDEFYFIPLCIKQ